MSNDNTGGNGPKFDPEILSKIASSTTAKSLPGMTIQPLFDRMLVRILAAGDRTKGGLFIPDIALKGTPWMRGEVVAQGRGHMTESGTVIPMSTKVGDVVIFFRVGSNPDQLYLPMNDEEFLCIRETHILGIVHGLERDSGLVSADNRPLTVPS